MHFFEKHFHEKVVAYIKKYGKIIMCVSINALHGAFVEFCPLGQALYISINQYNFFRRK